MRRQQEAQKATQQFLRALSAGQVHAIDRFGLPIEAGSKVEFHGSLDLVFDVVGVAPILDPKVPPGMLNVTLTVTFPMQLRANQITPTLIRLPHLEQQAPQAVVEGGEKPPNNEAQGDEPAAGKAEPVAGGVLGAGDESVAPGPRLVLTDAPGPDDVL